MRSFYRFLNDFEDTFSYFRLLETIKWFWHDKPKKGWYAVKPTHKPILFKVVKFIRSGSEKQAETTSQEWINLEELRKDIVLYGQRNLNQWIWEKLEIEEDYKKEEKEMKDEEKIKERRNLFRMKTRRRRRRRLVMALIMKRKQKKFLVYQIWHGLKLPGSYNGQNVVTIASKIILLGIKHCITLRIITGPYLSHFPRVDGNTFF